MIDNIKSNKIAILYICTGKYVQFWEDFFKTAEQFLLTDCEKHYFVFTDSPNIYGEPLDRIHKIIISPLAWPYSTLMRFHMFIMLEKELLLFDYIYFFNANTVFVSSISDEIFPSKEEELVVVQHPAFYVMPRSTYTYENRPSSNAYIADNEGDHYVMGAFNGGQAASYLSLIRNLIENINIDLAKGIIAICHDESHLNRYIIEKKFRLLSPA